MVKLLRTTHRIFKMAVRWGVVEVNPTDTEFTASATESLRGPAGALLERLLRHALGGAGSRS